SAPAPRWSLQQVSSGLYDTRSLPSGNRGIPGRTRQEITAIRTRVLMCALAVLLGPLADLRAAGPPSAARPNVLWITCEDISPNLGCYGDTYAVTPNLDR